MLIVLLNLGIIDGVDNADVSVLDGVDINTNMALVTGGSCARVKIVSNNLSMSTT